MTSNPGELSRQLEILLDKSIELRKHHSIVEALYEYASHRFVFASHWYVFRESIGKWIITKGAGDFRKLITGDFYELYMKRREYYKGRLVVNNEKDPAIEAIISNIYKVVKLIKDAPFKRNLIDEARPFFERKKFEPSLNENKHLLAFENGVYDFKALEFRKGKPEDNITYTTRINYIPYDPESKNAIEIKQFMEKVHPSPEVKQYWLNLLSSIIDGSIKTETFHLLTGDGSNGKSASISLLQRSLGDYACILPIALLTQRRAASNSAQSEVERTKGRRLAVLQEPGNGEVLNIGLMKELTGGDVIQARALYGEPVEFRPQFKILLTCNELPEVNSSDGGTWRRIRVVNFTSRFVCKPNKRNSNEFEIDPELYDKYDEWAPTFLSMLIDHHKTMNKYFTMPKEIQKATDKYKLLSNPIDQYVNEAIVIDERSKNHITLKYIFSDFKRWFGKYQVRGKRMPEMRELKTHLEKMHCMYPDAGWTGLRFKLVGSDISCDDADVNDHIKCMKDSICIDKDRDITFKELGQFRIAYCDTISINDIKNYLANELQLKESKNLIRDGIRGVRGFIGAYINKSG